MREASQGLRGNIKPLPEVKPYEPVAYTAFDQIDPFQPAKLDPARRNPGARTPDLNRPREPLEAYALESIRMVGTVRKDSAMHGIVQVDKSIYQVRVGNHMGQNFGVITGISDGEITLKELVQDGTGDWSERTSSVVLQEPRQEARK